MRERRWESAAGLAFDEILGLGDRLAKLGLKPAVPTKDIIGYIEDWTVAKPDDFDKLDPWATEDVTLVHVRDDWQGDFFLLAGGYHTVYQRYQAVGTYCSISHPWRTGEVLTRHDQRGMLWLGFRHAHSFIRVRLKTAEVITPGESRADQERALWLDERRRAFQAAIQILDLSIEAIEDKDVVALQPIEATVPFFCSWPDAFGPCQFEYNSSDPFEFLVPASKLAATCGNELVTVRSYLTGFTEEVLTEFADAVPGARACYRCSVHCPLDEVPEILDVILPDGRLYATLCEFQTQELLPAGDDASAIVGLVGGRGTYQVEVRLNRAPLPESQMPAWIERLIGLPVTYAPLPPFP
ncbi:MAG: hypothetical protein AB7G48_02900 [Nitrospiraceae bacterium]